MTWSWEMRKRGQNEDLIGYTEVCHSDLSFSGDYYAQHIIASEMHAARLPSLSLSKVTHQAAVTAALVHCPYFPSYVKPRPLAQGAKSIAPSHSFTHAYVFLSALASPSNDKPLLLPSALLKFVLFLTQGQINATEIVDLSLVKVLLLHETEKGVDVLRSLCETNGHSLVHKGNACGCKILSRGVEDCMVAHRA